MTGWFSSSSSNLPSFPENPVRVRTSVRILVLQELLLVVDAETAAAVAAFDAQKPQPSSEGECHHLGSNA